MITRELKDLDGSKCFVALDDRWRHEVDRFISKMRDKAIAIGCNMREVPALGGRDIPQRFEHAVSRNEAGVIVRIDWTKIPHKKPLTHALDGSYPNGGIKARAICGAVMPGPILDAGALSYEQRAAATCERCRQG